MLSCVVDHILQEFNILFLARFRTCKISTPPQTKTPVKTTFRDWCRYSSFVHGIKGRHILKKGTTLFALVLFGSIPLSHQLGIECKKEYERGKGGNANFFKISKFFGSFPDSKFANYLDVPVRKLQNLANFLELIRKLKSANCNPQIGIRKFLRFDSSFKAAK
jgi:hypothetical protein